MTEVSFEVPVTERAASDTALLVISGACVLGGAISTILLRSPTAMVFAGAGIVGYAFLLHTSGRTQYFEYLSVGASGITYHHTPGKKGRVSRYAWGEIQSVKALLLERGDELQGLSLVTNRASLGGVPIFLAMDLRSDCLAALRACTYWLDNYRAKGAAT